MAAWRDERGDKTSETMLVPGPVGYQWFIGERLIERIKAMAQRTKRVHVNPPIDGEIEVPVHRIAEYIPAAFIAVDEGAEDALNDSEARIYKVSDDSMALVYNQGVLTFDCTALRLVLDRLEAMSTTDLAEVLDLVED